MQGRTGRTQGATMDSFDRQIVQFIVRWAPFGGPPDEEVLPRFGLTPAQLRQRFTQILSAMTSPGNELNDEDAALLAAARRAAASTRRRTAATQRFRREQGATESCTCVAAPRPSNSRG